MRLEDSFGDTISAPSYELLRSSDKNLITPTKNNISRKISKVEILQHLMRKNYKPKVAYDNTITDSVRDKNIYRDKCKTIVSNINRGDVKLAMSLDEKIKQKKKKKSIFQSKYARTVSDDESESASASDSQCDNDVDMAEGDEDDMSAGGEEGRDHGGLSSKNGQEKLKKLEFEYSHSSWSRNDSIDFAPLNDGNDDLILTPRNKLIHHAITHQKMPIFIEVGVQINIYVYVCIYKFDFFYVNCTMV